MEIRLPHLLFTAFSISLAGLFGCSEQGPPETKKAVQPVKTLVVNPQGQRLVRQFPGLIDANQKVKLSFRVPGKLQSLPVKEGELVDKGQIIAQLDPSDYQIIVNNRQASYQEAEANFKRGEQLLPKGHISKTDYDRLQASYKSTRAAYNDARQQLGYTKLKAPFAGRIAKRLVHNFEEVQIREAVVELQDISSLEVKIDIPERLIKRIRSGTKPTLYASFLNAPGQHFPLTPKEFSTSADPQTQTFRVTLQMARPEQINILPGMTTSVTLNFSGEDLGRQLRIPNSAISADSAKQPQVWVVDENSMTVSARLVDVGELYGREIEIRSGLQPGDRIVIAGVSFLSDGLQVALLPEVEQAEPLLE